MIAMWIATMSSAQGADQLPEVCLGHRPDRPARSWFDTPNADPWPGLTIGSDTATWTRLARTLERGRLPPRGSVRPEELVQALAIDAPPPPPGHELVLRTEVTTSPWARDTSVVRVTLTGRRPRFLDRPRAHVVLVIDEQVQDRATLSVAQGALRSLITGLRHDDTVAIIGSGSPLGGLLGSTPAEDEATILGSVDRITPTSDGDLPAALEHAYDLLAAEAQTDLRRVLLLSDGDLDLVAQDRALTSMVTTAARDGIGLVGLGFGERHARDDSVEALVRAAGGSTLHLAYPYDGQALADHLGPVLEPAAIDTRVLVEWNPSVVAGVHRVGNHLDRLSGLGPKTEPVGGELGVGQTATVLYEVRLHPDVPHTDIGRVTVRATPPGAGPRERKATLPYPDRTFEEGSADLRLAVAAASLGELLAGHQSTDRISPARVASLAASAARAEYPRDRQLVELARQAAALLALRETCPVR